MPKRVAIAYFGLCVVFGILIVNLALITLNNTQVADTVGTKSETIGASRGGIYDRNLKPLVNIEKRYVTYALPSTQALAKLKPCVSEEEFNNIYTQMSNGKIVKVNTTQVFNDREIKSVGTVKRYSGDNICTHLIGYVDADGNGVTGLEKVYDNYLKMTGGSVRVSWSSDAMGRVLLGREIQVSELNYPDKGGIELTIDKDIQSALEKILIRSDLLVGAGVVMDSETSEILASVSLPLYDPENVVAYLNKENAPFINRADTPFSVGSVFKPFVAAAALENDVSIEHYCNGITYVGSIGFRCNNGMTHGATTMQSAMEKSCNTFFIQLGQKVGSEKIINICTGLGLGRKFEYEDGVYSNSGKLPSEASLTNPSALANFSFGQGDLLATPWQMAAAYSAIANGGVYNEPVLMRAILGENKEEIQKLYKADGVRVMSKATAQKLDLILKGVVENGTAKLGKTDRAEGRGKTATAQSGSLKNGRQIVHTWFCGYFTYQGKTYTVVIFKEDGTSGANDCAPVFKDITEKICDIVDARQ